MTANLMTLNSCKTEFLLIGLKQQLAKLHSLNITQATQLPILVPPTKEEVYIFVRMPGFVCLSVCLCARLLKNARMDLDEMLRVDRCRDMDELINFWARSGSWSGCRNRIASSDIA